MQNRPKYTEIPVIFLSIFEHNSNLIPWRETGAKIELIPMNEEGDFNYQFLENILQKYRNYNGLKVAALSAGSNITGNIFNTDKMAILCH
jgi:selenocysteine lyase/cysteine desulfurase